MSKSLFASKISISFCIASVFSKIAFNLSPSNPISRPLAFARESSLSCNSFSFVVNPDVEVIKLAIAVPAPIKTLANRAYGFALVTVFNPCIATVNPCVATVKRKVAVRAKPIATVFKICPFVVALRINLYVPYPVAKPNIAETADFKRPNGIKLEKNFSVLATNNTVGANACPNLSCKSPKAFDACDN